MKGGLSQTKAMVIFMIDFEKKVKITVESEKYDNSEALIAKLPVENGEDNETQHETIKFTTEGTITSRNGRISLDYDDSDLFDGEQTGVSIVFEELSKDLVSMMRGGSVSTAMVFESGKRHICLYTTPFMTFEVCIHTAQVKNRLLTDGTLELDYSIEVHGVSAERTRMKINIAEI